MHKGHYIQPALNGFEAIHRKWDKKRHKVVAKVLPGEFYITQQDEFVFTLLGSCVSACIWDEKLGVGGLNHFLLPEKKHHEEWHEVTAYSCRYGNWAMEQLINEIQKCGGSRNRMKAKIFGGGRVLRNMTNDIGESNIEFVRSYLQEEGIDVTAEDVGGPWPRKVLFHPETGKAHIKRLNIAHQEHLQKQEKKYLTDIELHHTDGDIELF